MEILKDGVYFKSIDRFFPRSLSITPQYKYSVDDVIKLRNVNIFADCKCNIAVYTESEKAFRVHVRIFNPSESKKDMITSFLKIEKKLDAAYGRKLVKQGRLSWTLFGSVSSKRKVNNAIVEHCLFEHFDFCESITVQLV